MVDLSGMKNAVSMMVSTAIIKRTENQKAKRGVVSGGCVTIGNKVLPYYAAVDVYFKDGDSVWCILADSGRTAVVIGV
jgi:hypothetical protein